MPSRRTFLKAGVAVSTSSLLLNPMANAASQKKQFKQNYAIVIDQTLMEAGQFSTAISDLQAQTYQVSTDISGLWMNTLEPKLKQAAFPIGGLTRGEALFYLEYLSKEYGMRLYYRIEHRSLSKTAHKHKFDGHIEGSSLDRDMDNVGHSWPTLAAKVIKDEISEGQSWHGGDVPLLTLSNQTQNMQERSFSWLLVPVTKGLTKA